ncbi:Hypothetical protein CINCED_3A002930 [Cinara cedri]|nr:Hypothetical protein CINCED_3A002930 [Cinara cedri]
MTGCGKSSLVVEVLNDPIITIQYLQGYVQWIHVGQENPSDIACIQTELLNRLNEQEQPISPPLNIDYEATRKTLRNLWKQKKINGLLVLDDVSSSQIVKYLDIGCKILITTHDISIMDDIIDTRVKYVKVNEGFQEKETLTLFSKCLNIDYKSLPHNASVLHKICKGFPLTISLIGAQLETHQEETINNKDRWTFYLEELTDKTSEPFRHTQRSYNQIKSLERAIEMCIKSLPDYLQKKYQDFSLFVYDLNIKPEVLSVLWNLKKIEVEDIMLELTRKNLVVRVWNQPLNSYVYSIHDLLLKNLKKNTNYHESKALHKKLIECYRVNCNGQFANLPKNDNYIFLYFGYHLKNADMLGEFSQWFLNLKFLESKICVTGPADVLADLRKYRKYIAVRNVYEGYINEIENFIKRIGPNLYQTKCDIVQLGLQEPETSFVYNESYKIAKTCWNSYFYYNIRASQNFHPEPHISIVRENIATAIFGKNYDEVIYGTTNGIIKVWNLMSHKCLHTFNGHSKKVTHLVTNKLKNQFLSTSDDSTICIWNMYNSNEFSDSESLTPPPQVRQEHWQNVFHQNNQRSTDISDCVFVLKQNTAPVIFAQFSPDNKYVVSCSTDKTLKIWRLKDVTIPIPCSINLISIAYRCYFLRNDFILFLTQSEAGKSGLYGCEWPFKHHTGLKYPKEKVLSFFPISCTDGDDKLVVMSQNKIACYQLWTDDQNLKELMEYPQPIGYQNYKMFSILDRYPGKINNNGYIAIGLSNNTIQICDLSNGYNFLHLNNPVQGILNLDWYWSTEDQNNWLLCAAEDRSIRLWCINEIENYTCAYQANTKHQSSNGVEHLCKNEVISLQDYKLITGKQNLCYTFKQNFDAVWLDNNSILIAAATKCRTLKILLEGLDQWSLIDNRVSAFKIVNSNRKIDQTMILVACVDYSVHMLSHQTSKHLFDSVNEVEEMYACYEYDTLTLGCLLKYQTYQENYEQIIEIWVNNVKSSGIYVKKPVIDCYMFHERAIVLHNFNQILVTDVPAIQGKVKFNMNCLRINGSSLLDHANLAVVENGNNLNIYQLNSDDDTLSLKEQYEIQFNEYELISISISHEKDLIVLGGKKDIVLIDRKLNLTKQFTIDPNVNNIQSMVWSLDDTCLAIKDDNHIISYDIKSGKKIASIRLTADKFAVDHTLKTFIAVNTAGQLVMLKLFSNVELN